MAFCNSCGAQMEAGVKFCPKCGQAADAATPASGAGNPSSGSVPAAAPNDNVMGALSYLLIPAIIFLVVEPYNKNRFIRFHSFQAIFFAVASLAFNIAWGILATILSFVGVGFILWMLSPLISLLLFAVWIILIIKAYQGQEYKLPWIGDLAVKQA